MDEALYACRFVQFTAAMLIFGAAAFRVYALAGSDTRTASSVLAEFDAWFGHVALAAALVTLISAIALVLCQAATMAGPPAAAVEFAAVSAVLLETRFGRVWCWHLLCAAILVLVCLGRHPRRPVVLFLSLGLLASLGWIGHAAMDDGTARVAHELNQTGHLLAAGLWLGGLVPLAWVLRQARRQPSDFEISLARDALRNFSHLGYVAVALIALTGAINTFFLVGSPGGYSTPLMVGCSRSRSWCSLRWWWHRLIASILRRGFLAIPARSEHWAAPSPSSKVWPSRCSQ